MEPTFFLRSRRCDQQVVLLCQAIVPRAFGSGTYTQTYMQAYIHTGIQYRRAYIHIHILVSNIQTIQQNAQYMQYKRVPVDTEYICSKQCKIAYQLPPLMYPTERRRLRGCHRRWTESLALLMPADGLEGGDGSNDSSSSGDDASVSSSSHDRFGRRSADTLGRERERARRTCR